MKIFSPCKVLFIFLCAMYSTASSAGFMSKIPSVLSSVNIGSLIRPAVHFVSRHVPATVLATACVVGAVTLAVPAVRRGILQSLINACISNAKHLRSSKLFSMAQWLGADLNAPDAGNATLLYRAAYQGDVQLFNALFAAGARANLNAVDSQDRTLLCRAAQSGNMGMAEALLAAGADPNLKEPEGQAAIHYAAREGHEEIIRLLARNHADLNAIDGFQLPSVECSFQAGFTTPLGSAILHGHTHIVQALLDEGVNPESRCSFDKNALGAAVRKKNIDVIQLLIKDDKNRRPRGSFRRMILAVGWFKDSTLHHAVRSAFDHDGEEIVKILLAHSGRAALNVQNFAEQTPLHVALVDERIPVALMLIAKGADTKIKDARGESALQVCPSWARDELLAGLVTAH